MDTTNGGTFEETEKAARVTNKDKPAAGARIKALTEVMVEVVKQTRSGFHARSEPGLLEDLERIIDLNPEMAHGTPKFRVAEQQLHGAQILGVSLSWCVAR